jgi:V/A-type H+-transporting ATPase subunit I
MVAKMKKYIFLAYHKDYEQFLNDLRNLGMIHVVEQNRSDIDEDKLFEFITRRKQLEDSRKTLNRVRDKVSENTFNNADANFGREIPAEIEKIEAEKLSLKQQLMVSVKEREALKPWGNFNPEKIKLLRNSGYNINFFICSNNQYNQ